MQKNIIKIFLLVIILTISGCIGKTDEEPKIKNKEIVSLDKVIQDLKNYNNNLKRAVVAEIIMSGIYVKDGMTYQYYSITKLEVMSFEDRAKLFYDIEESPEDVSIVIENKIMNFLMYSSVEELLSKGGDASDGIGICTEIYNVENGQIMCGDGNTLKSIAIEKSPNKINYVVGENNIDLTGLVVIGTYVDGTTKVETITNENISGFDTSVVGFKNIIIDINGRKTVFIIRVDETVLNSIAVTTEPIKKIYYSGESGIDLTGLVVTGTYSDGTTKIETIEIADISNFNTQIAGIKNVIITKGNKTATFPITVIPVTLSSISITSNPTKTSYYVGDSTIDLTGLVVTGTYNNGTTKIETATNSNISGFNTITSGSKTLTVTLGGKTATFPITVIPVTLSSISITSNPTKTSYYVGDSTIDLTGLVVTGTYNNGTSKVLTATNSNISGFNTITSGSKILTVTLGGKTATFPITVIPVTLSSISITSNPTKTSYYVGDSTIDLTGLVVTGTYNNGTSKVLTATNSNISGFNTITSGSKILTVTLGGKTATFPITVVPVTLSSISITSNPTKTSYYVGDSTIDLTGLVVTGTYNNGTSKVLTATNSNISEFNTTISGIKTVVVTLGEKTATFPIIVSDAIKTATFTMSKYIDILKLKQYSATFEVADTNIKTLILTGNGGVSPGQITLTGTSISVTKILTDSGVNQITVKAVDVNGNQVGALKTVILN